MNDNVFIGNLFSYLPCSSPFLCLFSGSKFPESFPNPLIQLIMETIIAYTSYLCLDRFGDEG